MKSSTIKMMMEQTGMSWEEVIDEHFERRKQLLLNGGVVEFSFEGEEIFWDSETIKKLNEFELTNLINPRKHN